MPPAPALVSAQTLEGPSASRGGHRRVRQRLRDADGKPLRMNLTEADKQALEAFLRTFTDTAMITDPKFSDPF